MDDPTAAPVIAPEIRPPRVQAFSFFHDLAMAYLLLSPEFLDQLLALFHNLSHLLSHKLMQIIESRLINLPLSLLCCIPLYEPKHEG